MADRELLELAAKAAGIEVWFPRMSDGNGGVLEPCHTSRNGQTEEWNPLTDDGDALRLAVKLRIEVDYYLADVQAKHDDCDPVFEMFSEHADPYAATRRAIVRAAAEIGKGIAQTVPSFDLPEDNYYKTQAEAAEIGGL